ncbi:MAG TPA: SDR family oxidoreductase [Cyclobacteriaceae bacterium]|nr:SDR family oxidoreductase [Cyclobacteriaceae bacterium]
MAYALITGASGGIGWSIAKELASRKHNLLLIARSGGTLTEHVAELRSKYGIQADYLTLDLSAPGAAMQVKQWLDAKGYAIDILINNAGYGSWGTVATLDREQLNNMMQLNMITLADLCKVLLPYLQEQQRSYIMNVGSTAAYQAVPTLASYAATKAFVLLFSRGLRLELLGSGTTVSCLSPGATSTGFIDRANMGVLKERSEKFSMPADAVARIGVNGMFAGKAEIIPGFVNWISVKLVGLLPKALPEKIAAGLYKTGK